VGGKRGGGSALLLGIRLAFSNLLSRVALRAFSHELEENGERRAIIYKALGVYAGADAATCFTARFSAFLVRGIMKLFMLLANGNEEEAREALRDPALRRGVRSSSRGWLCTGSRSRRGSQLPSRWCGTSQTLAT